MNKPRLLGVIIFALVLGLSARSTDKRGGDN
jgi:hypothetical protein